MRFPSLERYTRRRPDNTRCGLCGATIGDSHAHILERARRTTSCACGACAILFRDGERFRTVPTRVVAGGPLHAEIPMRLAYLVRHSGEHMMYFPSPAGAVESATSVEVPLAAQLQEDVEAILIHKPRRGETEHWLVPIDWCHRLVGSLRRTWRGIQGGDEAEQVIDQFLQRLRGVR